MAAKIPKNIRFRPDQISALEKLESQEVDFSALVRIAVDELLASRTTGYLREEAPKYGGIVKKLGTAAAKFNKAKKQKAAPSRKSAA